MGIQSPYFLLDTGFTCDLVVPSELAKDLGLNLNGVTPMRTDNNEIMYVQTGTALRVMECIKIYISILVSKGIPLLGISFMEKLGYKAIIDCNIKLLC